MSGGGEARVLVVQPLKIVTVQKEQRSLEESTPNIPKPRSGHRAVCDDGQMYVFGGYNPLVSVSDPDLADDPFWKESNPVFRDLWIYSFVRKRWRKVAMSGSVPAAAVSHCLFLRGQYLLCYGGSGKSFGMSSSNVLSLFDLTNNTWSVVPVTGQVPMEMYGQGGVVHGNKLYVVGGTTGHTYSNEVHVLDLTSRVWTQLSSNYTDPGPDPRYRHEIAFHDDKLWIFGGGTAEDTFDLSSVPVFDLKRNIWETVHTNPDPVTKRHPLGRRCHSLVHHGDYVYICGGCDAEHVRFTMVWRFHFPSETWYELACSLPHGLYFHSACVTAEGKMYIFGGVKEQGMDAENTRTDGLYSVWLTVPTLKAMAWEVLVEKDGCFLSQKSRRCLIAAGIPRDLASRYHPASNQPAVG